MSTLSLSMFSDEVVIEEAVSRLRKRFFDQHNLNFNFGKFEFVFHEGMFQGIDERPTFRSFGQKKRLSRY